MTPELEKQGITNTKTALTFYDCPQCRGFGYQVTASKKHITCPHCKDNPSMYAMEEEHVVYWGAQVSKQGIRNRKARRVLNTALNILLMLASASGVVVLVFVGYQNITTGFGILDIFTTPRTLMVFFWISVLVDGFLYFRLLQIQAAQHQFTYSEQDKPEALKKFANPEFDKFHHARAAHKRDISTYFTTEALQAIERSYTITKTLNHHVISPLHLFAALLDAQPIAVIIARLGISRTLVTQKLGKAMLAEQMESGQGIDLGLETNRVFFYAYEEAQRHKRHHVDVMELFVACISHDPWVNEVFYDMDVDEQTVQNVVEWIHVQRELYRGYSKFRKKAAHKPKGIMDRAMTARESKLLESVTSDYTSIARMGGYFPLIGRATEMDQMLRILRNRTGNILLVGEPGVGKSTLLEGLANLMAAEEVPKELQDKRLVVLDPGSLIANAQGVGAIEGRVKQVINDMASAGNVVLGIEDVHHLLNMRSTTGSEDAAGILMNAMSQGMVKVVATTTTQEYQQFVVQRGTFLRRFQVVTVNELERDPAIVVLEARSGPIEGKHKVFFSYAALAAAVDFSIQYIQDRYLPAKALDLIEEAATLVEQERGQKSMIQKEDVARVVAEKTNVQVTAITDDERDKLLRLEEIMHKRIVGQDTAVEAVASALRRAREGLRDTKRPIATLLFLGPTGVGKTETAKTIAEVYFGNESNMIRLDMSEYQDASALQKLIGGKGEQGYLTEAIRMKPFAIVLLDELEKAHPDVLNVFLQVLDDGRITDGTGHTFNMSNTMIIATSNAATQQIQNGFAAGISVDQLRTQLMNDVLPNIFRPEFINRFDNVVVFKPLTFEEVVQIADRLLKKMSERLDQEKGITLEVSEEAVRELAQLGYDPLYGARPLRRVIQDTVDDALSRLLLSEQIRRRDIVRLLPGGHMEIEKAERL